MRVKVFTSRGPFNGVIGKLRRRGKDSWGVDYVQTLEDEINRWLAQHPAITVVRTEQSLGVGWFTRPYCVITVWYEPPRRMLTRETAELLLLDRLRQDHPMDGDVDTVAITQVIERPFGWVFWYNSKKFVETGDERQALLGNHPVLVDRFDCTFHRTGFGDVDACISRYERTGSTEAVTVAAPNDGPATPSGNSKSTEARHP